MFLFADWNDGQVGVTLGKDHFSTHDFIYYGTLMLFHEETFSIYIPLRSNGSGHLGHLG